MRHRLPVGLCDARSSGPRYDRLPSEPFEIRIMAEQALLDDFAHVDGLGIESEVGVARLGVGEERVKKLGGPVDALDRGVDALPFERGVRLVCGELQVTLCPGERGSYVVRERGEVALEVPLGSHAIYMRTHGAIKLPVDRFGEFGDPWGVRAHSYARVGGRSAVPTRVE